MSEQNQNLSNTKNKNKNKITSNLKPSSNND